MSHILKVKVPKTIAGIKFPYDLIYLMSADQRELIHKLWQFALVMPFEESFQNIIYKLRPQELSQIGYQRDDSTMKTATVLAYNTDWWQPLRDKYDLDNRVVVVPMLWGALTKQAPDQEPTTHILPKYISARNWISKQAGVRTTSSRKRSKRTTVKYSPFEQLELSDADVAKIVSPLSTLAYLSTPFDGPDAKIRPICSVCSNNFQHLQGKCKPGMPVCYECLDLSDLVNLRKKMVIPQEPVAAEPVELL